MSEVINMKNRTRKYLTVLALSVSGGAIYLIPYIRYVFYDYQIEAMGITNAQLGLLSTVYAIGCMALYIPGGLLADRFPAKRNILISLLSTSILTLIFAFSMSYNLALIIWFLFSFTTAFVFWTSLFKTLRIISGENEQGRMFGLYYAGNGLFGGLINAIGIFMTKYGSSAEEKFFIAVIVYAASTAIAALLIFLIMGKEEDYSSYTKEDGEEFKLSQVATLAKSPVMWFFALIVFAGYAVYTSTSYFTPYLTEVRGISAESSGVYSIIRTYFLMLLAPVGGFLADKVFKSSSRWFMCAFLILVVIYFGVLFIPHNANETLVSIYTLLPGAVGLALYGVIFSVANEARIPVHVMGTAVGIASIVGYTPDFFMATLFGFWLDKYGASGYQIIFAFLATLSFIGFISAFCIRKIVVKNMKPNPNR